MSILITGAGGTVGRAVGDALERHDVPFRLAHHDPRKVERSRADGRDAVALDVGDPSGLRRALSGIDTLFLVTPADDEQVDRELALLERAVDAGVAKIVKLSVWRADERAFEIARRHRDVEQAIEGSGLRHVFLRPNGFMQNFVHYLGASIRDGAIHHATGDAAIAHVDVRDIARVATVALSTDRLDGEAPNLGGPRAISYATAAEILSDELEHPVASVAMSAEDAFAGMVASGMPESQARRLSDLQRYYASGAADRVGPDIERITGSPPTDFSRFVRDHASSLLPHGA